MGDGVALPDLGGGEQPMTGEENVGFPCDPAGDGAECLGRAVCLAVGNGVGLCTVSGCTMEDLKTPDREDSCPAIPRAAGQGTIPSVCTRVPVNEGDGGFITLTFCLPGCRPDPVANACAALDPQRINPRLACDPVSILLNDHSEVCLFPACATAADCGNKNPLKPDATCDELTGTCQMIGKEEARVGDPCKVSSDCGKGQYCFPERTDDSGQLIAEGGYCTLVGCKFGDPWSCPEQSKCFGLGSASATISLCLAVGCNPSAPQESDGCRDQASPGQYACILLDKVEVCWLDVNKSK